MMSHWYEVSSDVVHVDILEEIIILLEQSNRKNNIKIKIASLFLLDFYQLSQQIESAEAFAFPINLIGQTFAKLFW